MPDRIVRASILTSDSVSRLSWGAEVFYRRLFNVADDYGRFDARPSILRAALYPLQIDKVTEANVLKWLDECTTAGVVSVYSVSEGQYLEVLKFNQRIQGKAKYPSPSEGLITSTVIHGDSPGKTAYARASSPSPNTSSSSAWMGSQEGKAARELIGGWFGRRLTTRWSENEEKSFKALGQLSPDDLALMASRYTSTNAETVKYLRRDLQTLLNNWSGELDKARMEVKASKKGGGRAI